MLSDDMGEKSKVAKFLHVVFNVIEKHCCVSLSLIFALFSYARFFLVASSEVYLLNSKQENCQIPQNRSCLSF